MQLKEEVTSETKVVKELMSELDAFRTAPGSRRPRTSESGSKRTGEKRRQSGPKKPDSSSDKKEDDPDVWTPPEQLPPKAKPPIQGKAQANPTGVRLPAWAREPSANINRRKYVYGLEEKLFFPFRLNNCGSTCVKRRNNRGGTDGATRNQPKDPSARNREISNDRRKPPIPRSARGSVATSNQKNKDQKGRQRTRSGDGQQNLGPHGKPRYSEVRIIVEPLSENEYVYKSLSYFRSVIMAWTKKSWKW